MRLLKIVLAAFAALFCLMYAVQNLFNLQSAYSVVALVVGMEGHQAYPKHFGAAITVPVLIWTMLTIIIVLEILAGLLAAKGTIDLWSARNADTAAFNASKRYALLGTGLGVVIWFGIFSAIGGAYFQMWQTEVGDGPLMHAAFFSLQMGVLWLIIRADD